MAHPKEGSSGAGKLIIVSIDTILRASSMLPRLCIHKSKTSPRWFVRIDGHRIYLGPWSGEKTPSKAIQAQYKASIRQLLDPSASPIPQAVVLGADLTILEAAVAFIADQLKQHGKKAEDNADFALRTSAPSVRPGTPSEHWAYKVRCKQANQRH